MDDLKFLTLVKMFKKSAVTKWQKLALALALVIIVNVFFQVGLDTFYPHPDYDEFCGERSVEIDQPLDTQEACLAENGTWTVDNYGNYCEDREDCWEAYDEANQPYMRDRFIVSVILGLGVLLLGMLVAMPTAIANGLLYGGILSMTIGTLGYWGDMDDYLRFAVSGAVLIILILVGIKKLKD